MFNMSVSDSEMSGYFLKEFNLLIWNKKFE